jgi:hypothetical protein
MHLVRVRAQFGVDSDEVQRLGPKQRSKCKAPVRRNGTPHRCSGGDGIGRGCTQISADRIGTRKGRKKRLRMELPPSLRRLCLFESAQIRVPQLLGRWGIGTRMHADLRGWIGTRKGRKKRPKMHASVFSAFSAFSASKFLFYGRLRPRPPDHSPNAPRWGPMARARHTIVLLKRRISTPNLITRPMGCPAKVATFDRSFRIQ